MANPAHYESSHVIQQFQQREHRLRLFVYQIYNGPESDQNQKLIVLTKFPRGFGNTSVIDWAAYDDILPKGKLVARAQGIHVQAGVSQPSRWFTSFNLVFTDGRFKGSGLKVDGAFELESGGELAIVGGTGEFARAQGTIASTYTRVDEKVLRELDMHFGCPVFTEPTPPIKVLPPAGGDGGQVVDVSAMPQHLESVTIRHGDVIDSISFSYIDITGRKQIGGPWGGNGGISNTINLKPTETVKRIMGTKGNYVNSLKIITNLDTYGPYGKENGTEFTISEKDNNSVVGFYGRAGSYIDAIGIYAAQN